MACSDSIKPLLLESLCSVGTCPSAALVHVGKVFGIDLTEACDFSGYWNLLGCPSFWKGTPHVFTGNDEYRFSGPAESSN